MSRSLYETWLADKAVLMTELGAAYEFVKKANGAGEHLLALEAAETVLAGAPSGDAVPLLQQKGRALAALGSTSEARSTLDQIPLGRRDDPETFGLLARVFKDLAAAASDGTERRNLLEESRRHYQKGFDRAREVANGDGAAYCGINAASTAALVGDMERAEKLAQETLEYAVDDEYYSVATRAEASLILQQDDEACRLYTRAFQLAEAKGNWGDLASTKKQCRAVSMKLHGRANKFDSCFPKRTIAIFAGHMIDRLDRTTPRFPERCENEVRGRIVGWIKANDVLESFSSAACGSDVIFLEAAQATGIKTHVVLPFDKASFIESSVRSGGERWVERFERVTAKEKVASTTVLNDEVADDKSSAFDFTNRMIAAKAALRASALDFPKAALAVWDRRPGDGRGGTADAVRCWCKAKIPTYVIHPTEAGQDDAVTEEMQQEITGRAIPFDRTQTALPAEYKTAICAILHMYFAGYFSLRENQYFAFQKALLGAMAKTLAGTTHRPTSRAGLGPDYVFVFDSVLPAGMFAGEMVQAVSTAVRGSGELELEMPRICLHAGPVQLMVNPVLNQYSHEGATLTRAGRIVRQLAPGTPYCTEPFASLAVLEAIREFQFGYVGSAQYGDGTQDRLFSIRFS